VKKIVFVDKKTVLKDDKTVKKWLKKKFKSNLKSKKIKKAEICSFQSFLFWG
jgi:hypothetical protein